MNGDGMGSNSSDFMKRAMALLDESSVPNKQEHFNLLMLIVSAKEVKQKTGVDIVYTVHRAPKANIDDIKHVNFLFKDERKNHLCVVIELTDESKFNINNIDELNQVIWGVVNKTDVLHMMTITVNINGIKFRITVRHVNSSCKIGDGSGFDLSIYESKLNKDEVACTMSEIFFNLFSNGVLRSDMDEKLKEEIERREISRRKAKEYIDAKRDSRRKDVKPLTDEQREFLARQKEYMKSITYEYKR